MAEKYPYKTGHCGINHHAPVCSGADGLCSCWCHLPLPLEEVYQACDVVKFGLDNPEKIVLEMDVQVWVRLRQKALA